MAILGRQSPRRQVRRVLPDAIRPPLSAVKSGKTGSPSGGRCLWITRMDHEALLTKYMRLVIANESISYVDTAEPGVAWPPDGPDFTADEIAELRRIEAAARDQG